MYRWTVIAAGMMVLAGWAAARAQSAECYVELQASEVQDSAGECLFDVRVCTNQPLADCPPERITRLKVRSHPRLDVPLPPLGDEAACGAVRRVQVRSGTRVKLRARASTSGRHVDRDSLVLRCARSTHPTPPPPPPTDCFDRQDELFLQLGRFADFPPSVPLQGCEQASNYATPLDQLDPQAAEELHVVSVYRGELPPGVVPGPGQILPGDVDVRVRARSKPALLYLRSFEPVHWHVHADARATVSRIIVEGPLAGTAVDGADGVPVGLWPPGSTCGGATAWEIEQFGGPYWRLMMDDVRRSTHLQETSFQGCATASHVAVPYWTGAPPDGPRPQVNGSEDVAAADVAFPGCEAVTAESAYCLTTIGGQLAVAGLESGTVCPVVATAAPLSGFAPSLGWRGEVLYACPMNSIERISLRDGSWESTQVMCTAVTDDGNRILAQQGNAFSQMVNAYTSYGDLAAGTPSAAYPAGADFFPTISANADRLLTTSFGSGQIDVFDFHSESFASPIALPDGALPGISFSETGDGGLVIGDGGIRLHVVDVATGEPLCDRHLSEPVQGLACVSRRSSPMTCPLDPTTTSTTPTTSTTTTTLPGVCTPRDLSCCYGTTQESPCWQTIRQSAVFPLPPGVFCSSIDSPGDCPDNCAAATACLLEGDCPLVEYRGGAESTDILPVLCTASLLGQCELREGTCPADPSAPLTGTP